RRGGTYLITGGLGQIGLALAEHLARTVRPNLVLVGRSSLPAREAWDTYLADHGDEDTSATIRRVRAVGALGAEGLLCPADAGDVAQMAAVRDVGLARLGAVHGVVHAAGHREVFAPLDQTDAAVCARHAYPKATGARVLEQVFAGDALDFALSCSSLSVVLGGIGMTAYAAANAQLDALATTSSRRLPWVAVDLDAWRFEGPARHLGRDV